MSVRLAHLSLKRQSSTFSIYSGQLHTIQNQNKGKQRLNRFEAPSSCAAFSTSAFAISAFSSTKHKKPPLRSRPLTQSISLIEDPWYKREDSIQRRWKWSGSWSNGAKKTYSQASWPYISSGSCLLLTLWYLKNSSLKCTDTDANSATPHSGAAKCFFQKPQTIIEHAYSSAVRYQPGTFTCGEVGGGYFSPSSPPIKKEKPESVLSLPEKELKETVLQKVIPGEDGRKRIKKTTDYPYSIHVQLNMKFSDGTYKGSGVLVGPHHVLTCGHNVYHKKPKKPKESWADKITAYPARNKAIAPYGKARVTKVYTFNSYVEAKDKAKARAYDMALLLLNRSVGESTGWGGICSATDDSLKGQVVHITGYPGDKNSDEMWEMGHTIKTIKDETFDYEIDTYRGQSGSAIWIRDDFGGVKIIGVHTVGANDKNSGVRISSEKFTKFLQKKIESTYKIQTSSSYENKERLLAECPSPHPDFVGRESVLKTLNKDLLRERGGQDNTVACLLWGLGGIGKSELALQFAHTFKESFFLTWVFDASSDATLDASYRELAKNLQIPFSIEDPFKTLQEKVHQFLEEAPSSKPYFLIFDNVEEKMNPKNLPKKRGVILITAREKTIWKDVNARIPLDKFEKEEAYQLLENITKEPRSPQMEELSEALGYFPFYLNQVAHYIAEEECTISEYLAFFDPTEDVSIDNRYKKTFATVWNLTFDKLRKKYPLALDWLEVCAFLHPDKIPTYWLDQWLQEKKIKLPDKEKLLILGALKKHAFIRKEDKSQETISLHRLLQDALLSRIENSNTRLIAVYTFIKKHSANFSLKNDNPKWMPHVERILEIAEKKNIQKIKQDIYYGLGTAYQSLGEVQKALEYHKKLLEIAMQLGNQAGVGRAYGKIGVAYQALEEYEKALQAHKKRLEIAKQLGDQVYVGVAYFNIGIAYRSLGEYQKALKYHKKHLEIVMQLGNQEGIGKAYGNIGNAYQSLGDSQKAQDYYRKALEYHKKYLEIATQLGDQAGVGRAYGHIGNAYQSLGDSQKAQDYYRKALKIGKEIGFYQLIKFAESKLLKK